MSYTLKSEACELEIVRNPRGVQMHANVYYGVTLKSGQWPSDRDLIVACDNGDFSGIDRTFGGTVDHISQTYYYVTVYID